jgi:hypothetical protein
MGVTACFLLCDFVRFFICYLLKQLFSVAVKEGRLYLTESEYKGMNKQ